ISLAPTASMMDMVLLDSYSIVALSLKNTPLGLQLSLVADSPKVQFTGASRHKGKLAKASLQHAI
ncbi:MAG: hypothetical protein RL146_280, partial [Actinomycetota bacterium]